MGAEGRETVRQESCTAGIEEIELGNSPESIRDLSEESRRDGPGARAAEQRLLGNGTSKLQGLGSGWISAPFRRGPCSCRKVDRMACSLIGLKVQGVAPLFG